MGSLRWKPLRIPKYTGNSSEFLGYQVELRSSVMREMEQLKMHCCAKAFFPVHEPSAMEKIKSVQAPKVFEELVTSACISFEKSMFYLPDLASGSGSGRTKSMQTGYGTTLVTRP